MTMIICIQLLTIQQLLGCGYGKRQQFSVLHIRQSKGCIVTYFQSDSVGRLYI